MTDAPRRWLRHAAAKPLALACCALPLAWLVLAAWLNKLGANPPEALQHATGLWALRFLCLTLAVTPLRVHTGWSELARFRRMLGLTAAAYATLHALTYLALDMRFDVAGVARDVLLRPFMAAGTVAWLLLCVLACTSTRRAVRSLGARRWKALHRLVYAIAVLALLHFSWLRASKNDFSQVGSYAAVVAVLLLDRLLRQAGRVLRRRATKPPYGAAPTALKRTRAATNPARARADE